PNDRNAFTRNHCKQIIAFIHKIPGLFFSVFQSIYFGDIIFLMVESSGQCTLLIGIFPLNGLYHTVMVVSEMVGVLGVCSVGNNFTQLSVCIIMQLLCAVKIFVGRYGIYAI